MPKKKKKTVSDHFWKLRCRKSARGCGANYIRTQNLQTPQCTPLWREAHFEVKMYNTHHVRTAIGSSDVEKVHAVVGRSTFRSQNVKKKTPGVPTTFGSSVCASLTLHYITPYYTLHSTPLHSSYTNTTLHYIHYTTLHYTPQQLQLQLPPSTRHYTPPHSTTLQLHCTTLHNTTHHYTTLHYITLHYLPLHFTTLHYITLRYTTTTTTTTTTITIHNYTPLHSTTLHYTHYTKLHYTTRHYTTLRSTTLHYIALH